MTGEYLISDGREVLKKPAAVACVDLAWARPHRNGVYVTYPTHSPPELWEFVDATMASLQDGGWAFFDADDWLLPRLIEHLRVTWGDVAKDYSGGGYRRTGAVVYDGSPAAGQYFTNAGYHVVMAHKGETDRATSCPSKVVADRVPRDVRQAVEWGTLKPIAPYERWIDAVTDPGERVYVPCAGTAPGAIAAERLGREWIAVDSEPAARDAYETRRDLQERPEQATL